MALNIIKGIGALFLVFAICFVATSALSVANGTPTQPNFAVAFAWIGTAGTMFYSGTRFLRRFAASLLGSIASLVVPFGFSLWTVLALSAEKADYLPIMVLGLQGYVLVASLSQAAIAYIVARAVVKRGLPVAKVSSLAAA